MTDTQTALKTLRTAPFPVRIVQVYQNSGNGTMIQFEAHIQPSQVVLLLSPILSAERVAEAAAQWQKAMDDWHVCWHAYNAKPAQKMTAEDEKRTLDAIGEAERALSAAVRQWLAQQQGGATK